MKPVLRQRQLTHRVAALAIALVGSFGTAQADMPSAAVDWVGGASADMQSLDNAQADIAASFHPAPIAWAPCSELPQIECGKLRLPVDYRRPHQGTFEMGVVRARATDSARRIGVLITNPGGPGLSGVNSVFGGVALARRSSRACASAST